MLKTRKYLIAFEGIGDSVISEVVEETPAFEKKNFAVHPWIAAINPDNVITEDDYGKKESGEVAEPDFNDKESFLTSFFRKNLLIHFTLLEQINSIPIRSLNVDHISVS